MRHGRHGRRWGAVAGGGVASNGVVVVASLVVMVRWATIMGMRKREREGKREGKRERRRKTKKKQGDGRRKMVVVGVVGATGSGTAGSDMRDSNAVDCNDEGIEFLDAKVNGQLMELVSRRNDVIGLLNSFTQFDSGSAGSVTAPLVVIQTTKFDCEGLAIGISICHAIADGFTMVHFVTAWATANRAGINQSTRSDFNLASLCPAKDFPVVKPDRPLES
ncbi:hypothetical protein VitviT2T_022896 [Vitis vinifera]|uniref:Uncharacterized protein n=1 Tax=Vitis vinifera TaxID=29760 RepID=A0ABY9DCL1_VITVI|nr:hypothetical protein VitviT2T_022896 [Vitis vinifera]